MEIHLESLFSRPIAPRSRLRIALLVSLVAHIMLLLLIQIELPRPDDDTPQVALEVSLSKRSPQSERTPPNNTQRAESRANSKRVEPTNHATSEEPRFVTDAISLPTDTGRASAEWQDLIRSAAREVVLQKHEEDRLRAAAWRRTHSIMFAPSEESLVATTPFLPDLPFSDGGFRGFGFSIGKNCYVGPVAGALISCRFH